MKKIHIIGCLLALFAFTMAGCTGGADGLFDKQVKFYKERNELSGAEGKADNEQIDKLIDKAAKDEFATRVKEHCDAKQIDRLTKYYECGSDYIKKLDKTPYSKEGLDQRCMPMVDEKKVPKACVDASKLLLKKFEGHIRGE